MWLCVVGELQCTAQSQRQGQLMGSRAETLGCRRRTRCILGHRLSLDKVPHKLRQESTLWDPILTSSSWRVLDPSSQLVPSGRATLQTAQEEGFRKALSEAAANTSQHLFLCPGTETAEWPLMRQNNDPFSLISCLLHRLLRKG